VEHLTLKAATVSVDQELGEFEVVVSAWDADREGDLIERDAFDRTIAAWQQSGKRLPLLFEHSTTQIGSLDPQSMRATEEGLVVAGKVDRDTPEGAQVWRAIKDGSAGFSIGFASESYPRKGGGRVLTAIDLLEVSATSKPMNASTRALTWKSASTGLSDDDLWLPREAPQTKAAPAPRETVEQHIERIAQETRPIRFESFG
jgi:HK97 family phage prohead protease